MNGYKKELNENQKNMLEQIRENLSDVLKEEHDDDFLLRFLRARSFHEDATEAMLRAHLRWRKHFSVHYFLNDYKQPESCEKYLKLAILGFNKEGNLIRLFRVGRSDVKGVLLGNNSFDVEQYLAYVLTKDRYILEKRKKQNPHTEETVIYIGDFDNFNAYELPWKYSVSMLIRLVRVFEDNFPEHLKAVYMINCPTLMYVLLKFLKPFMSEVTASKIKIYGRESFRAELLKNVGPQILPDFLGGTRNVTEDDNICKLLTLEVGKFPESSYYYNAKKLATTDPGVFEAKVERRKNLCIDVEVPDSDYAVIWEVDIQEFDLGVGFFVREKPEDSDGDLKCLKPVKRLKSNFSPFMGLYICEQSGRYVLMLDNRYSYFTDKTALYRIQVKAPLDKKQ